jgi:hypothetical protein
MKIRICYLLFTFILIGCQKEITKEDIAKINGYWEIEKVVLPDGNTKEYAVNSTIDYFEIKGDSGIRKKVTPVIDGTYRDNGPAEKITVAFSDGKAYLNYNSEFAKWNEEIVTTGDSILVFKNANKLEYHYKRPITFSKK